MEEPELVQSPSAAVLTVVLTGPLPCRYPFKHLTGHGITTSKTKQVKGKAQTRKSTHRVYPYTLNRDAKLKTHAECMAVSAVVLRLRPSSCTDKVTTTPQASRAVARGAVRAADHGVHGVSTFAYYLPWLVAGVLLLHVCIRSVRG